MRRSGASPAPGPGVVDEDWLDALDAVKMRSGGGSVVLVVLVRNISNCAAAFQAGAHEVSCVTAAGATTRMTSAVRLARARCSLAEVDQRLRYLEERTRVWGQAAEAGLFEWNLRSGPG